MHILKLIMKRKLLSKNQSSRITYKYLIAFFSLFFYSHLYSQKYELIKLKSDNGCNLFLAIPFNVKTISWSGLCLDGYLSGKGTLKCISDKFTETYEGETTNGLFNGQVTWSLSNGTKFVGEFLNGRRNGKGTLTLYYGDKYEGDFNDDWKEGFGTYSWKNGDKYVGEYNKDSKEGFGTFIWQDGDKYVGEWKNNKREGQGALTSLVGDKYMGEWKEDVLIQGTAILTNGNKYIVRNGDLFTK